MRTTLSKNASLGDVVVAAFDRAACHDTEPRKVSELAMRTVAHMLQQAHPTERARKRLAPLADLPVSAGRLSRRDKVILDEVLAILGKLRERSQ